MGFKEQDAGKIACVVIFVSCIIVRVELIYLY
jgi:hypothetical protein